MLYKGIIHAHSTYSYDGKLSLSELKQLLLENGIHFACMSEHTDELSQGRAEAFVNECRALSDSSFVFVPGFEVPYQRAHILQLGSTEFLTQISDMDSLIKWSKKSALTVLAHPVRNKFKLDEILRGAINGVEIWNQQYEGKWLPRTKSVSLLRQLRKERPTLLATGGIDFHRTEHFGTPLTFIELSELTEESICTALKAGQFSFGTDSFKIHASSHWKPTLTQRVKSCFATTVIGLGKRVNKTLAQLGISLPTSLRQKIRKQM